jgi:hypothetical protein
VFPDTRHWPRLWGRQTRSRGVPRRPGPRACLDSG